MFGFLKRLFSNDTAGHLEVNAYWCETTIKLSNKIQTPLGSRVGVVKVCVDIQYSIDDDQITIRKVTLRAVAVVSSDRKPQSTSCPTEPAKHGIYPTCAMSAFLPRRSITIWPKKDLT